MNRLRPMLLAAALLMLLTSCAAAREGRVRTALTDAGLSAPMAACMAPPLAQDLSNAQLRALGRLGDTLRQRGAHLSEGQLLDRLRHDLDAQTAMVVLRAGTGCLLRG